MYAVYDVVRCRDGLTVPLTALLTASFLCPSCDAAYEPSLMSITRARLVETHSHPQSPAVGET